MGNSIAIITLEYSALFFCLDDKIIGETLATTSSVYRFDISITIIIIIIIIDTQKSILSVNTL